MRFVTEMSPPIINFGGDELKKVDEIRPIRSKRVNSQPTPGDETNKLQTTVQRRTLDNGKNELGRGTKFTEERRKVCMRVRKQPVLVEFRSGKDRRRHNLRASDIVEHIDEEV